MFRVPFHLLVIVGHANLLSSQLASIGALLTIMSLGFETFSQQVLNVHDRAVYTQSLPGIARVSGNYSKYCHINFYTKEG